MFDLKDGLGAAMDLANQVAGDELDLTKIITEQFIKENTKLAGVKELLEKVGIHSLQDAKDKIPQLESVIQEFSSFSSWKEFVAKATEIYLKNKA